MFKCVLEFMSNWIVGIKVFKYLSTIDWIVVILIEKCRTQGGKEISLKKKETKNKLKTVRKVDFELMHSNFHNL